MKLEDTKKRINKILNEYYSINQSLKMEKNALKETQILLDATEQAQSIVQIVAQNIQQYAHTQIAKVVSKCLQTVFYDENYGFKINS